MVGKSVKPSRPMARNLSDAEVAGYLNTTKESLLMKMAWEMMNPEYQKGTKRKPTTVKKKDAVSKTVVPSKTTSATTTQSNAESESKKRLSSYINYDVLDKLFDDENSPKRTKLEEPVFVSDKMKNSQQCLLEPHEGSEEDEPVLNEDYYSNEDANGGDDKEFYGDADLEYEDEDEGEDTEDIIW